MESCLKNDVVMKVGLIDVDGHNFPNLALMKIAGYHKRLGDQVEWVNYYEYYSVVYKSKVFTFSEDDCTCIHADRVECGGTGYDYVNVLAEGVEHSMPDYSLYAGCRWYKGDVAYGYTTRGCTNHCGWCIVPVKEGYIRQHAAVDEFLGDRKKVVLMDNNILAHCWGMKQIEELVRRKVAVDFNQGLDARRIADCPAVAELLGRVKYIRFVRMACDTPGQLEYVRRAIELLKKYGVEAYRIFVYCLVRSDLNEAEQRVMAISKLGAVPFAQPYRDYTKDYKVPVLHKRFAWWVNHIPTFRSCTWSDFKQKIK